MKRAWLAAAVAMAACGDFSVPDSTSVPDRPTWNNSVQQVLSDHCVNCHGTDPNRGAPGDFRLDVYESTGGKRGAAEMAQETAEVVGEGEMPPGPGAQLGPNDKKILEEWARTGTPRE